MLLLLIALSLTSDGQEPDTDTLFTRGNKIILVTREDSVKMLNDINLKADTIMADLRLIKDRLGISDIDTTKTKQP